VIDTILCIFTKFGSNRITISYSCQGNDRFEVNV